MLSPTEMLALAEGLAARIPLTPIYAEERDDAWLALGLARLKHNDILNARKALESLSERRNQVQLRLAFAKWTGEHPDSDFGRTILLDTVAQLSAFEDFLTRSDIVDLIPATFKVIGAQTVQLLAGQIKDPFTRANVHVTLSYLLSDVTERREQLLLAEKLATSVREGDRDWAIRWVFSGYQRAGLAEDAERVRRLASLEPEQLTRQEEALFADTDKTLADIEKLLPSPPPDTPLSRLRRFLEYRINDLKVIFLTEASLAGHFTDTEIESLIRSESFLHVEEARSPRLSADTTFLDTAGMAKFLFRRPVCRHPADRTLLEGQSYCDCDPDPRVFVRQMTGLFRHFRELAEPFSEEQIEQGLWFVLGHPFWLRDMIKTEQVRPEERETCLRSMIYPFSDYLLPKGEGYSGTAFFMWWDSLLYDADEESRTKMQDTSLEVIDQILQLPSKECQFAALHGLNHLHPNPAAEARVRKYLGDHRQSLSIDENKWVEACALGDAQ